MASEKTFQSVPPFPDDVPIVNMSTISLARLNSGDVASSKGLIEACRELGFFLLDLTGDRLGETLTQEIDQLFVVIKEIMNLPEEVKEKYLHDPPRSFLG